MSHLERWEERFSAPGYLFGTEPNAFLRSQADLLQPGMAALAVADGDGRNGVWLAQRGLDVHAVDFSPTALAKARALARGRGVTIRTELADLVHWKWPAEAYDAVVAIFVQFTMPDERSRMFAGMKRALRRGGVLLLEGYRTKQLEYGTGGPRNAEQLYTRDLLEAEFGDLADLSIREYDAELDEGERHAGMSALIDLVGRK
ncbi:MAG TPA: class I SAM-dependent methyltransferase [Halothiobacillaceae bacterium]|nr:class I SAM-dependent methyltransferase [Halothiobacillaceae bacterium]